MGADALIRRDAVIYGVAVLARLAALWRYPRPGETYYLALSDGILKHGTFGYDGRPTTWIEPLYPAVLAALRWLSGDREIVTLLLQVGFTSIGAVLLARLTERLGGSRRSAVIAGLLFAVHPYLVRQAAAYQDLNLTSVLLVLAALQFARSSAVWLGATLGLLVLARLSLAPLAAVTVALLLAERQWRRAAAVAVTMTLLVAPWLIRNHGVDGTLGGSRAGENLYVSTAAFSRQVVPRRDVDLLMPDLYRQFGGGAREANRRMFEAAIAHARAHPLEALYVKARNAIFVYSPRLLPYDDKSEEASARIDGATVTFSNVTRRPLVEELAFAVMAGGLLLFAAVGVVRRRHELWNDRFLLLTVAAFTLTHAVFFPTTRLVSPMYFVLMFYAAVAADTLPGARGTTAAAPIRR